MSLRKDLPEFVKTEYERAYYEGYIKALMWVMQSGDKYNK
jgi:hypothetical protein